MRTHQLGILVGRIAAVLLLGLAAVRLSTAVRAATTGDENPEVRGILESFPAELVGEWVVAGVSYQADSNTEFKQEDATFAVDGCVEVEYVAGSPNQAVRIDAKQLYECQEGENSWQAYGRIVTFPAGQVGTWVVGTTTYTATVSTEFQQEHGPFAVNQCVEVKFEPTTLNALEIETEDDYHCANPNQPFAQQYGLLEVFPEGLVGSWTVSGQSYTATTSTQFEQSDGPFVVGRCVEVKYLPTDRTAIEIETKEPARCAGVGGGGGNPAVTKSYGTLVARPEGTVGDWTIGALTVVATTTTTIEESHGMLTVGVCASATHANGVASKIESEEPYHCQGGTATNFAYGLIETLPTNWYGTWLVSGVAYQVNPSTELKQEAGPFALAACVKVEYFTTNGVNQATEVETEGGDDCAPNPQGPLPTSKIYATVDSLPASPFVGAWMIGGLNFAATAETFIEQNNGALGVGQCVEALFTADGTLAVVETKTADRCQPLLKLYGIVEAMPPIGQEGSWQISGHVLSSIAPQIDQSNGLLVVGAFVEVGYVLDLGVPVIMRVETHVAPGAGRTNSAGTLQSVSADGQTWQIDGQNYTADPAAEIGRGNRAPEVGGLIFFNSYATAGTEYLTQAAAGSQSFLPIVVR